MDTTDFEKNFYFSIAALYRRINKIATQEIAFTGFTPSYAFLILAVKEQPGIRISELAKKLQLEISTVTRLIEKLESRNFIIRDSAPGISRVYLSESGNQIHDNMIAGIKRITSELKSMIGKKATKELGKSIRSTIRKLDDLSLIE